MTVRRRRLTLLLVTALAAVSAAAGCTGGDDPAPAASDQELRIGLLAPLKGPNGPAGVEAQRGAQLAADVINGLNPSIPLPLAAEAGLPRLGGTRVKIVPADASGSDPQVIAGTAVTRLVSQEGADALIGAFDPQITEYASQRSERFEIPFLNADSPATFLTEAGRDWFFRLGPSWRSAGESFFSLLRQKGVSPGKIVVLHAADKAGQDVLSTVRELAEQGGYGAPEPFSFAPNAGDLLGVLDEVRAAKPDTIFLYATPATVQPLIEAFATRQYRTKAVMSFGLGYLTDASYQARAPVVTGLSRSVSWAKEAAERNQAARAVASLYQRRYNTAMTEAAASAFTAVLTTAQAVNAAGTTQPQRVRSALLSLNVPGDQTVMPWAGIQFDETHQNVLAQSLVEQFINRSFKIVYPEDASSGKLVWPADKVGSAP